MYLFVLEKFYNLDYGINIFIKKSPFVFIFFESVNSIITSYRMSSESFLLNYSIITEYFTESVEYFTECNIIYTETK